MSTPDPEPRPGAKRSFFQLQTVKDGITHLLNEIKKSSVFGSNLTRDACVNVIFSVIMMDEYLRGIKGQHKYQTIRLPFELFEDFRIGGSLDCVLRGTLETMVSHSISVLNNNVPLEKLQAILDRIWEHITLKGLWSPTRILFDSSIEESKRTELEKLALALGATIVKDKSENPSHIIVDEEIVKPASFVVRDIDIDTKLARLHWVGTPSSYDDWVSKTDSMTVTPVPGTCGEPVTVSSEWLALSHKYNEWMPASDFQTSQQRKRPAEAAAEGDGSNSKAVKSEAQQVEPSAAAPTPAPAPAGAVPAPATAPAGATPAAPPQLCSDPNVQTKLDKVLLTNLEEEPIQNLRELYRVPAHASWYRPDEIHEIEKRYLPEFFNGKSANKTPRIYKQARQFFISKFRENTGKAITFTESRRYLTGDVGALQRVFNFLESWGLINYFPREELKEKIVSANSLQSGSKKTRDDYVYAVLGNTQGVQVVNTTIPSASSLYSFRRENQKDDSNGSKNSFATTPGVEILTRKPTLGDAAEDVHRDVDYTCDSCSGDCSYFRFHCQTKPDFDLCPLCYHKGNFPSDTAATDFIKLKLRPEDITQGDKDSGWTDHETLMLLEALEMYGDDWKKVSEHVGTKSKSECVIHFLRMPIEDPYIEELEKAGADVIQRGVGRGNGMEDLVKDIVEETEPENTGLPFGDLGNPVMAQISFLAAMLGPKVAAAAAKAALQAISKDDPTLSREAKSQLEAFQTRKNPNIPDSEGGDPQNAANQTPEEETAPKAANADKHDANAVSKGEIDVGKVQRYLSGNNAAEKPLSSLQMKTAAATALAAAATKAKLLADQEAREIQRLASTVVDLQLKKANVKLRKFQLLEEILERERQQMEQERAMMYAERVRQAARGFNRHQ